MRIWSSVRRGSASAPGRVVDGLEPAADRGTQAGIEHGRYLQIQLCLERGMEWGPGLQVMDDFLRDGCASCWERVGLQDLALSTSTPHADNLALRAAFEGQQVVAGHRFIESEYLAPREVVGLCVGTARVFRDLADAELERMVVGVGDVDDEDRRVGPIECVECAVEGVGE